jgi:two-component system phosphate regulon response regulator OmpR
MQELNPHILIVDDDNRILTLLKKFLSQNGFLVSIASSAIEATELIRHSVYDLIILDVMLPEVTGLDFAKTIKAGNYKMPIIMLTALSDAGDKIRGLESGASDYLTKPFEPMELLLRIRNLINTHNQNKKHQEVQYFGNNWYNFNSKEFVRQNNAILLSSTEQKLLEIFIDKANETITREELSMQMGGLSLRSIDVQIVRIRNKIEDNPKNPKYLRTVRNKGYALYT